MINSFFEFAKLIFTQKGLIVILAKRELAAKYVGSFLGFLWAFIQPLVMIVVFWFVFSVGFKVKPTNNVPFVVWLSAGMAAWFAFADIINGSTGSVILNSHLIKKTLLPSEILPVVTMVSSLLTHVFFLVVLVLLILFQKLTLSLYSLQFLYYLFCLIVLAMGVSFAASALNVFIRDIGQVVSVILQIGFWATPVFWDIGIFPQNIQNVLKLNPMFYIVQGYRESFIYKVPFWEHPTLTAYFWGVTVIIFISGALIFKKLKPQFADVL